MESGLATNLAESSAATHGIGRVWTTLVLVTLPVVVLDQLSKTYIVAHFQMYQSLAVIPNWLDVTYTLNPGAAFSLFATMPDRFRGKLFIILSIVATVVLIALLLRRALTLSSTIALALILGGTIGNLIDRIARSRVVDFIYFHHDRFSYPVFNIADSAITIGAFTIIIFGFFSDSNKKLD